MIIRSILDTDFYKLSIQNFILTLYPDVEAEYAFHNRDKSMKFTSDAFNSIYEELHKMQSLELTSKEYIWLKNQCIFSDVYLNFLSNYKFDLKQIDMKLNDGDLEIRIKGKWVDIVLWEVPLMSLISEVYFKTIDRDWSNDHDQQHALAKSKAVDLSDAKCTFTDFGTRRRRSRDVQETVVSAMKGVTGFSGTSNPYFAMKYGIKAIGTMAHEVICGLSALESINRPNKVAMEKWRNVYGGTLSIFLPDTYGIDSFLKDFDNNKADLWSGVRHDSGCPFEFTDKIVTHYKKLGINPHTKSIIFSDSLDVKKAIELRRYCLDSIQCTFGIGTHFSNDFKKLDGSKSKPLNMVIKLIKCNGQNVCKLSQNPEKAMGDPETIRLMNHLHFGKPL